MRHIPTPSQSRGVALLLVLAAVLVTTTALAALVRVSTRIVIDRSFDLDRQAAHDLIPEADRAIREWLGERAGLVVLPPNLDARSPGVEVFSSMWDVPATAGYRRCELVIVAWDQCAQIPVVVANRSPSASPMRRALNPKVARAASVADNASRSFGLDVFMEHIVTADDSLGVFPTCVLDSTLSLGGWEGIATHNPSSPYNLARDDGSPQVYRVNVCTAPRRVLEAAIQETGLGGRELLQHIEAARAAGRRPNLGTILRTSTAAAADQAARIWRPELATVSTCWSLRIDIRVGTASASWWAVYVNESSNWECVQRLAIYE